MSTTSPPTERVGRYQLLEPIGIGPSGSVSRAKVFGVAGFERQFAVKRFHGELTATAAMAAMLSAAARAYGSLEHPRIARMSEFGVAQGATFTAVEYVPGLDALRLIAEVRLAGGSGSGLAAGGALALVSQAARAVGYAHGRGLTHLGLAPTNVIVTADGDIKITDFGILSATLPQRPIEIPRLAQRIPYLAPEQLANEATSAATDVFALGVLAYELVTGTRTFKGDSPQQVASAIMAGPPGEPPLPRPIVRVLQRCLARSPFERFPDARALADALDAALRVAPVPGTRKDIGAQVKETLDRLSALNEGQMSGVVALHLGTGPIRRFDDDDLRRTARGREPEAAHEPTSAPYELAPPDLDGPPALGAGATLADLPRPMTTVPGLPPPPIPVPHGVGSPAIPPPSGPAGQSTLLGMGKAPPSLPSGRSRPASVSGLSSLPTGPRRPPTLPGVDLSIPFEPGAHGEPTSDSAIHPLDPSELEPLDPASPEAGPARDDAARPPPDTAPFTDDFLEAPTHAVSADAPPGERSARPPAPRQPYRLDPSSVETKPMAPITLEPLLFDPIVRPEPASPPKAPEVPRTSTRPSTRPAPLLSDADEAWALDDAPGFEDGAANRAPTVPARVEPAAAAPDSGGQNPGAPEPAPQAMGIEPPPGRTILGMAAPPSAARAASPTPYPTPPAPDHSLDAEPAAAPAEAPAEEPPDAPVSWPHDAPESEPAPHARLDPVPLASPPAWTPPAPATGSIPAPGTAPPRRHAAWLLAGLLGAAVLGVAGWQLYARLIVPSRGSASTIAGTRATHAPDGSGTVASGGTTAEEAPATGVPMDATSASGAPADAARIATPSADARGSAAPADAGAPIGEPRSAPLDAAQVAATPPGPAPAAGDNLVIASTPPGARVFLDGADTGVTPLKLPGSPDRHTIALLLAGHELYVAQVDGHGAFQVPLKEVVPTNGPAGIKVLRCKDKERYYVSIDGKATGQTCPTERIGCELGPHTVEVYDVVSETRRKWDIVVKETRLSFRVRVDP